MKDLFYLFLLISTISFSQTLEHTYRVNDSKSYYDTQNSLTAFKINGETYYYTINSTNNEVKFYNSSHNLFKTATLNINIDISTLFLPTDKLFNSDSKIEFIIQAGAEKENQALYLFNEDGENLFKFYEGFDFNGLTVFKDSESSYKLLMYYSNYDDSNRYSSYEVYGLSGTLSVDQENIMNKSNFQFPNPATDILNITNLKNTSKNNLINIYTIQGKKVLTKKINVNDKNISLDISSLSKGVYMYRLGNYSNKFIKN